MEELGRRVCDGCEDLESGHGRWAVYSQAIKDENEWPGLLELVKQEPDKAVASSVVVNLLELLPESRRGDAVAVLPAGKIRENAELRSREISVLEALSVERAVFDESNLNIRGWSNWLQMRVAVSARRKEILGALSTAGSTKRIRNTAKENLRLLLLSGDRDGR
ncbi:hypothetical protein [Nocardiopsis algeriensis]|uniref:HEAT repeat domain-containing protein n=1 Tax=Nocardiopsis algeriensis TaxID=1478215 RepID=A0A841IPR1_9ACTN|nr:hypothetical protein [Nocardiopsis algeriensis]MBB6118321.1 hypothetical protein [Nocardiopsis algeriensis]